MKRLLVHLEDKEYEKLKMIKGILKKNWKDLLLYLADYYLKSESDTYYIPKDKLEEPYRLQAKALSEIGKLMVEKEDELIIDDHLYLASLFPLVAVGEEIKDDELVRLYILMTNYVFEYLEKDYENIESIRLIFEYMRVATIKALQGDVAISLRLLKEMAEELGKLT